MTARASDAFEWDGRGPAVLLLHGFTGTPWEVRPIGDALRAAGFACAGPLLPGHGRTPEALSRMRWDDWRGAVARDLETLRVRYGSIVLVGASLGGLLALEAAARRQGGDVLGVVTLAAALKLEPLSGAVIRAAHAIGRACPIEYIPKRGGSDIVDDRARRENPAYGTYPLRAAAEFETGQRIVRALLPSFGLPLLAVHGLRDSTTPLDASLELLASVASPDASLVVVPNSGHVLGVDRDRETVARQVVAFVERLAAARS